MTLPNLNDFEEFEFTRMDIIWIIINILAYLILGFVLLMANIGCCYCCCGPLCASGTSSSRVFPYGLA